MQESLKIKLHQLVTISCKYTNINVLTNYVQYYNKKVLFVELMMTYTGCIFSNQSEGDAELQKMFWKGRNCIRKSTNRQTIVKDEFQNLFKNKVVLYLNHQWTRTDCRGYKIIIKTLILNNTRATMQKTLSGVFSRRWS